MSFPDDELALEKAILAYLAEHPQAADTLVGIAEWWLNEYQGHVDLSTTQRVLDRLTKQGVLETVGEKEAPCYRRKMS